MSGARTAQPAAKAWTRLCITLGLGAMAVLIGCIVVEDHEPTRLTIVLFWEDGSDGSSIVDETCESAGVDLQSWGLFRVGGGDDPVRQSDGLERCENFLYLGNVEAGTYRLEISGLREGEDDDQIEWTATCEDLVVDRFDEEYPCEVFLSDPSSTPDPIDEESPDAGVDAGEE